MRGRGLLLALIVSVLLNVFVIGAVVGGLYRWQHRAAAARLATGGGIKRLIEAADSLPAAQRDRYRANLRGAAQDIRPYLKAAREARIAALGAFTAPRFDRAAVEADLEQARAADFAVRTRAEQAILDSAATLDAGARGALADGLRRGGPLRQPAAAIAGARDGSATKPR